MTEKIDYEESFDILVEDIFGKMIEEKNSDQKNMILDDIGLQIDFIKKEISKNSNILSGKIYRIEDFIKNDIELEDVVKRIEKIDKTSQDLLEFIDKHSVDIKNNLSDLQSSAEANNSKNTSEIIETLKKCSQELIAKDESLSSLLQSSDLSRKEIAKETMQVISEVGQLLNNNLDTLLSTIDENRQFTDDTYQKFTEVLQREKEILLTHASNLEEVFSESVPTETEVNDYLWFESDEIQNSIGMWECEEEEEE